MDKNYLLQVTNEIYRITLLFPKKEPLRYRMREVADDVLSGFISITIDADPKIKSARINDLERNAEIINSFLELAKTQNWVKSPDILRLQEEYSRIGEELEKFRTEKETEELPKETADIALPLVSVSKDDKVDIPDRQEKILEILKEKGRAQVWEIKGLLPEVSKRTLRRDFNSLVKEGLVQRMGERNETFYQIIDRS
ncbi:MAG: DeoR family transcriptional regulator [Patescibacteria group bacterium]|nr:DeoR family transcriptional regulator [Patescibacteria group bacterium]